MEICKACKQSDHPEKCRHKDYNMSRSKSFHKRKLAYQMYGADKKSAQSELAGFSSREASNILSRAQIDMLMKSDPVTINHQISCVYLSVDPSGGGSSRLGIVAYCEVMTENGQRNVVRDMESFIFCVYSFFYVLWVFVVV